MKNKYYLTNILSRTFLHKYLIRCFLNNQRNKTIVRKFHNILNFRSKTIQNYKDLYKHHLKAGIGETEIDCAG
jgi:hypothetical protein